MPLGSVVIPAHNEESVILRCLDDLLSDIPLDQLDVVVVCNGCSDRTAELVRASEWPVRVVELAKGCKTAALQAGDCASATFPRLYLDADVRLPGAAALAVLGVLARGDVLAARPPIRYDTVRCSGPVRAYYRARMLVPALLTRLWGAGVYGVSSEGYRRVAGWPEGLADDLVMDSSFEATEVRIVGCHPVVVHPPRTSLALVRVLARGIHAKAATYRPHCALPVAGRGRHRLRETVSGLLRLLLTNPRRVADVAVYAAFATVARMLARCTPAGEWARDQTSRRADQFQGRGPA